MRTKAESFAELAGQMRAVGCDHWAAEIERLLPSAADEPVAWVVVDRAMPMASATDNSAFQGFYWSRFETRSAARAERDRDGFASSNPDGRYEVVPLFTRPASARPSAGVDSLTASEALYGFAAWLTGLDHPVTLGANYGAAGAAEMVSQYCLSANLAAPRDDFHTRLPTMPCANAPSPPVAPAADMVLVPREPTKAMVQAACDAHGYPGGDRQTYARGYRSMIAAAPQGPQS